MISMNVKNIFEMRFLIKVRTLKFVSDVYILWVILGKVIIFQSKIKLFSSFPSYLLLYLMFKRL